MPAKKKKVQLAKERQRADDKRVQKTLEDKTFGLKNKNKSKKVQKYIKQIQKSSGNNQMSDTMERQQKSEEQAKKRAAKNAKKQKAMMKDMMAKSKIRQPKLPAGVDPKTVLCAFFAAGMCKKSEEECKYSHDLEIEKKVQRKDLYTDARRAGGGGEGEEQQDNKTSADWTQEELAKVVGAKQSNANKNLPTEKVCKFFLQAVERGQYGWFWECQNGDKCIYKHALPEGYVFKKDKIKKEQKEKTLSLEELVEIERGKLETFTPVTEETFKEWKRKRVERREAEKEAKRAELEKAAQGKGSVKNQEGAGLTGRALFDLNADLFVDDEGASETRMVSAKDDDDDDAGKGKGVDIGFGERDDDLDGHAGAGSSSSSSSGSSSATVEIVSEVFDDEDLDDLDDLDLDELDDADLDGLDDIDEDALTTSTTTTTTTTTSSE